MEEKMRCGVLSCGCGQTFYFETFNTKIHCIKCDQEHDISNYAFKDAVVEEVPFEDVVEEPVPIEEV